MKFLIMSVVFLCSICVFASDQENFQIPSDCKSQIEEKVIEKVGNGDDTFSVESIKLIYGGAFKGLSFPVVAIVKTSDEVDPRDVLVKTTAPENGVCIVEIIEVLADGLTIDL